MAWYLTPTEWTTGLRPGPADEVILSSSGWLSQLTQDILGNNGWLEANFNMVNPWQFQLKRIILLNCTIYTWLCNVHSWVLYRKMGVKYKSIGLRKKVRSVTVREETGLNDSTSWYWRMGTPYCLSLHLSGARLPQSFWAQAAQDRRNKHVQIGGLRAPISMTYRMSPYSVE